MDLPTVRREQLPSLPTLREPEILEELAQHLEDLYREQRSAGLDHEEALTRATRALNASPQAAGDLLTASRAPAARLLDRVHTALDAPVVSRPGRLTFLADLRRDTRYVSFGRFFTPLASRLSSLSHLRVASVPPPSSLRRDRCRVARGRPRCPAGSHRERVHPMGGTGDDEPERRQPGRRVVLSGFRGPEGERRSGRPRRIWRSPRCPRCRESGAERIEGRIVTGNYFDVIGVQPVIGRGFGPNEDVRGSPVSVVVLSYRLWQQRFGADASVPK